MSCSCVYEYTITRTAQGGGHSGFFLNNVGAAVTAKQRASHNLNQTLQEAVEPAHCPRCGFYQPEMVRVFKKERGASYDPNKFASQRIGAPLKVAMASAQTENSEAGYKKFIEVWPVHSFWAEQEIRKLRESSTRGRIYRIISWAIPAITILAVAALIASHRF